MKLAVFWEASCGGQVCRENRRSRLMLRNRPRCAPCRNQSSATKQTLEWLPKCAPELNDIERCWRDLKQHYLANRTFADVDALARAIPDAVARLNHERQPSSSPLRTRST